MTTYDVPIYDVLWRFMSMEQRDGNCRKMSQIVVTCRKSSCTFAANCRDIFCSRPLPAVPFWCSFTVGWFRHFQDRFLNCQQGEWQKKKSPGLPDLLFLGVLFAGFLGVFFLGKSLVFSSVFCFFYRNFWGFARWEKSLVFLRFSLVSSNGDHPDLPFLGV